MLFNRIITNLGIVANIKSGSTITTKNNDIIIIRHDTKEGIYRYLFNQSRKDVKNILTNVYIEAKEFSEMLLESKYLVEQLHDQLYEDLFKQRLFQLNQIKDSMEKCTPGIDETIKTYHEDTTFCQDLKTLKNNILYHASIINDAINGIIEYHKKLASKQK